TAKSPIIVLEGKAAFVDNFGHVIGGGVLADVQLRLGESLRLLGESGLLLSGGTVAPSDFSFLSVPLRVCLLLPLSASRGRWQPVVVVRGGVQLAFSGVQGQSMAGAALPEVSEAELAADVGAELGTWLRVGSGALSFAAGYDYAPVVSGDLLTGSLTGLAVTV